MSAAQTMSFSSFDSELRSLIASSNSVSVITAAFALFHGGTAPKER
jgi:hypothetical protein